MQEIKPLQEIPILSKNFIVFLSGSIEMGAAVDWQVDLVNELKDVPNLVLLNPRCDDWDSSWEQSIDNSQFREQVEWELHGMELADAVVFYFAPYTKSPVTLLELGLIAHAKSNVAVCCPAGYWRKGNVDIVCRRYGIHMVPTLGALQDWIRERVDAMATYRGDPDSKGDPHG